MIAVVIHADVVLAGIAIPAHRTLEVTDEGDFCEVDEERRVLSAAQARALVQAGYADAIEADFDGLAELIDDWQRT